MSKDPSNIQHWHRAAQQAFANGELREAHQQCLQILKAEPEHADAWFLCGMIAAHNGQYQKALEIVQKAVALTPDSAEYYAEMGRLYIALHEHGPALNAARRGKQLASTPGSSNRLHTLNTLGVVFSHTGEHPEALECFNAAVHLLTERSGKQPGHHWQADLFFNLAASCKFMGKFDDAEAAYESAISLQPTLFKAHSALAQLRKQSADNNHLARLEALRSAATSAEDSLHLGHAIAKEQEDLGHYHAALAALQWGKSAQREKVAYHIAQDQQLFSGIKQLFSAQRFQQAAPGCDNDEPIFIVGMPRTGTTLVEQILNAHPAVFAAGELQDFPRQVKQLSQSPGADVLDIPTLEQSLTANMHSLGEAYLQATRPRTGHTRHFIDKLPINFFYLGLIKLALPRAKLICLRRDPLDACLSNYRQLFATNFSHYYYAYDLLDCGRYYQEFNALMQHWQTVLPGGVYELSYEALVKSPEEETRALLEYCGLPWDAQCLNFNQHQQAVSTASAVQVRSQIYSSSIGRWQYYGDALAPLQALLLEASAL